MPLDDERLIVALEARIRDFEKNFAKAGRTADQRFSGIERRAKLSGDRLQGSLSQAATRVNTSMKAMLAGFAGGVIGGAATGLFAGITSDIQGTVKGIAEIGDEAKKAGVSVQAFQEWKFVADQNRISVDALTDGLKELSLRADEFVTTGAGSGAEAFARLGFTADELAEKLKDPSALMLEIIGRLQGFDKAAQIRIADEVFGGTGGEQFVQLIGQGEAALRRTIERAHETGQVLDAEMIEKAAELDRRFNELKGTVGNFFKAFAVGAAQFAVDVATMKTDLNNLFGGENQARSMLGDNLYDGLSKDQAAINDQAEALGQLRGQYRSLSETANTTAMSLAGASNTISAWGYEEAGNELASVSNEMRDLVARFQDGQVEAEDFAAQMQELQARAAEAFDTLEDADKVNFGLAISEVTRLGNVINTVIGLARSLKQAIADAAGVAPPKSDMQTFREADAQSMRNWEAQQAAKEKFLALEDQANAKSRDQLALDREIAQFRERAAKAGVHITDAEAAAGGAAAIAADTARSASTSPAGGGGSRPDAYSAQVGKIQEQIAALEAEAAARAQATGSTDAQERAVERARIAYELLHAAQEAGMSITPQLVADANTLASQYLEAEHAVKQLAQAQAEAAQRQGEFKDAGREAFTGLLTGAQSFSEALSNLSARLAQMAANRLFDALWGGLTSGGSGGFIGKLLGLKDGGIVHAATGGKVTGPGSGTSDSIPAMLSNGEFVINAKATRQHRQLLEAINSGRVPAFAAGGMVGGSLSSTYAPSLAINVQGSGNPKQDRALADMIADQVDAKLKANSGQGSFRMASGSALAATQAKLSRAASRRG